jgi:hypothetical protein
MVIQQARLHIAVADIAVPWEALAAFDILIFSLTVYHTWKVRKVEIQGLGENALSDLIFRDGAIYFL